ncbi:MAG: DNA primase [Phycisphaerales bacterium JB039]
MTLARTSDDRDRVKDATDIVRLVGEHVTLRHKGREFVCLCPFHDDHNPSMYVVPSKQIYHCFVCGAGGDVFDFVMGYHRMEFREAMEFLADRAGVKLSQSPAPGAGPRPGQDISRRDLLSACATAQAFYRAIIARDDLGRSARDALAARGVSAEMIERFGLGASPDRADGLASVAQRKGLSVQAFAEAGLLYPDRTPPTDVFRGRIMFPIRDQLGRAVAFGARVIGDGQGPKYLNSRETRIFHKSDALYGLPEASEAMRASRLAIVTEGYTDVIACHQAGVCNVVGVLGTALTSGHARVLRRLCDRIVLLFDGDEAGLRAADRATEVFFREPVDVLVATLSSVCDAKDPDELLKRDGGVELLHRAVADAEDLLSFRIGRLRDRLAGAGPAAVARSVEEEIQRLAELGLRDISPIRRQMIVRQIARVAGVDEATVLRAVPAGRRPRPSADVEAKSPRVSDVRRLLGLLLAHPDLAAGLTEEEHAQIASAAGRESEEEVAIATLVTQLHIAGEAPDLEAALRRLEGRARAAAVQCWRDVAASSSSQRDVGAEELRRILLRLAVDTAPAPDGSAPLAERLEAIRQRRLGYGPDRRRWPGIQASPER